MGIPCMSCKCDVASHEGKFFVETYVCPKCYQIAERLYEQGQAELRQLLVVLKEVIRAAILQGNISFPESLDGATRVKPVVQTLLETMSKCNTSSRSTSSAQSSATTQDVAGKEVSS